MLRLHKWWLGACAATLIGQGAADYTGYAPGTCTDQQPPPTAQSQAMVPCSIAQSSNSIRENRYRRTYGGK
jgi:hypothetical protein